MTNTYRSKSLMQLNVLDTSVYPCNTLSTPTVQASHGRVANRRTHCKPFDLLIPEQWVFRYPPLNLSELIGCWIIHVEWIYILEWNTKVMAKCRICGSVLEICSECGRKVCTGGCHKECGEEYGTYDPEYSKWYRSN